MPTAVSAPFGEITVTVSPGRTPSARASSRPSRIAGSPFSSGWRLPLRSCERMSWTTAGVRRSMPRTRPPWEPPPDVVKSACWWMTALARRRGLGPEMREQNDLADRRRVGEEHHETVDADPFTRRRRHAVLERADVVLVEPVRLGVAAREELPLLAEAGELVDRVVQLAVRVGQLAPPDEELEPVHERGVVTLPFGER